MRSPAKVEGRVSIVGVCTPVLALRNLEVDPVETVVPLLCPHQLFPIVLPWFRPTQRLRYQLWIFRLRVLHKIDSIVVL